MDDWFPGSESSSEDSELSNHENEKYAKNENNRFSDDNRFERRGGRYNQRDQRDYGGARRGDRYGGGRGGGPRRPPQNMTKEDILGDLDLGVERDSYWLNLHGCHDDVSEQDVFEYYKSIPPISVKWAPKGRGSIDVQFKTFEELKRAIDLGTGTLAGQPFFIRASKLFK